MRIFTLTLLTNLALGLLYALSGILMLPVAAVSAAGPLQSLIDAAPNGSTVNVSAGTYNESLTVNKTLTITGVSTTTTFIQAVTGQRAITVTAGNNLGLVNLTVTGGQTSDVGGGVYLASGNLTLVNSLITNNSAAYGGGVFQAGLAGKVVVTNSRIELNTASYHGGGLYVDGNATLTNAQILSNTATTHGGGLHVQAGRMDIVGGLFSNNRALNGNGGAANLNGSVSISGTQIVSNTAISGGGLQQWNPGFTVGITTTRFERNVASSVGGGAAVSSTLTISHSTFATNTVDSGNTNNTFGGGLYAGAGSLIVSSTFMGNSALCTSPVSCGSANGGGLYVAGTSSSLTGVTFTENQAGRMGGGLESVGTSVFLTNVIFGGNQAGWGGGLHATSPQTVLTNVLIHGNLAGWGGGMVNERNSPLLTNVTFSGNRATNMGGGMHNWVSTPTLVNCIMWNDSSPNGPELYEQYGSPSVITYSDIQGTSVYAGTGNINADPRFVLSITLGMAPTSKGNYHLGGGSPAVDAGNTLAVTAGTDLDGNPRVRGGQVDMGTYEGVWALVHLPLILK